MCKFAKNNYVMKKIIILVFILCAVAINSFAQEIVSTISVPAQETGTN